MMMMEGAIGINMTIRQEATLNWSCVGGRDVALLTGLWQQRDSGLDDDED